MIDNNSKDGSVEMLRQYAGDNTNFTLILNKDNAGFSKANNQGAKIAKAKFLLFLNSDTVIIGDALGKLVTNFQEEGDRIKFAGAKLFNADNTPQSSAGPFYTLPYMFVWQFLRGDHWGATRSSPNKRKLVDWVSGACLLTTKRVFDEVGGFDEGIFMYMEEIDLLYRARKRGYRTIFYPDAKITHLGSASSGGKTYPVLQVFRGAMYFYRKHHSPLEIRMLQYMLRIKAGVALVIGHLTGNTYLKQTYAEAYRITQMDR